MRKIILTLIYIVPIFIYAQTSYSDGCMRIRFVATQAWNEEYEDPIANDESNWQWWFADYGNYDGGVGWRGGNCLAQGGSWQIGWWDHGDVTIFDYTYGTSGSATSATVPISFNLRGHYEGDDCGGSCDYCTSLFDDDDYRYDETVSTGINYRFAAPNQNNYFTRYTNWHGSSDYGGQFYVNYTSPRPTVTANISQICNDGSSTLTFTMSGAIFGGSYVVKRNGTTIATTTSSSYTAPSSTVSYTYTFYTQNNGVNSLCYTSITVPAVNCDFNCLSTSMAGGTVAAWSNSADNAGGFTRTSSYFTTAFPANSYITSVSVPNTGGYSSSLMQLRHVSSGVSTSLVSLPTGIVNQTANSDFVLIWDNPNSTSVTAAASTLDICACGPASNGVAFVDGNSAGITICADQGGTITLSHSGSTSSMVAAGYGDELRWYTGSGLTGPVGSGNPLVIPAPTTTTTYYCHYFVNGTRCRSNITATSVDEDVTVTVNPITVGGTLTPATQTICVSTLPTSLTLSGHTGSVVRWEYSSDGGGSWSSAAGTTTSTTYSPITYAAIVGTHTFRAIVQNGSVCGEEPSTESVMVVKALPIAGSFNLNQTSFCTGEVLAADANGYSGDLQWQVSTTSAVSGFSNLLGETSPNYSTTMTNATSAPVNYWYRTAITNAPCVGAVYSLAQQVTVYPNTVAGSVNGTLPTICIDGNPGTLTLSGYVGTVQKWQVSYNGGAYSDIANTAATYAPGVLGTVGTYTYRAYVKSGNCVELISATYTVTVVEDPVASIAGGTTICQGSSAPLSASYINGTGTASYQWQVSNDGITGWTNTGTNSASFSTGALSTTKYYRCIISLSGNGCGSSTSNIEAILVSPTSVGGTATQTTSPICVGASSTINLSGQTGSVLNWEVRYNGGAWSSIANTSTSIGTGALTPAGTYEFRANVQSGVCPSVYSSIAAVVVDDIPNGGTTSSDQTLCLNENASAVVVTGNSAPVIRWEMDNDPVFGSPVVVTTSSTTLSGSSIDSELSSSFGEQLYVRAVVKNTCPEQPSSSIVVRYNQPDPIVSADATGSCIANFAGTWVNIYDPATDRLICAINDNGQNLGTVTASVYYHGGSPFNVPTYSGGCGTQAVLNRNFVINSSNPINASIPVSVRLYFYDNELNNLISFAGCGDPNGCMDDDDVCSINDLVVTQIHGAASEDGTFTLNDGTSLLHSPSNSGTGNANFGGDYVQISVTQFSEFWIHGTEHNVALPVELVNFEAKAINNQFVKLNWATATEINNAGFEIERSTDGFEFEKIGWADGNNNSNEMHYYSFQDNDVEKGIYYYRLKQIDNDGAFEYSEIRSATITGNNKDAISFFIPNPAENSSKLNLVLTKNEAVSIQLFNSIGQIVDTKESAFGAGVHDVVFDLSNLPSGTYSAHIKLGNEIYQRKLVIAK